MAPEHSPIGTPAVVVLDGGPASIDALGGKGAALGNLISWGLPVPPCAAVTTQAYEAIASDARVRELVSEIRSGTSVPASDVDSVFVDVDFDLDTSDAIVSAALRVSGGQQLAVRSSATVEDLAGSSFAGQYRSVLHVDPDDGLLEAVKLVFASLWHPAPCAYRRALGVDDERAAMCALIMRMVPAVSAGVVFTVDPTGGSGSARVEAVQGLGESLVSGHRTPDVWVIDRDEPDEAPPEIVEALRLSIDAEARAGTPQDVEWAWDGERVWLVQARPITASAADGDGFDDEPMARDLTTSGIGEMLPGVLTPLLWELNSHLVEEAFRRVLDDLGVSSHGKPAHRHLLARVRGRAALDFDRLRHLAESLPGTAADELEAQYFGSRRPGRPAAVTGGARFAPRAILHDIRVLSANRRNTYEAQTVVEAVEDLVRTGPDPGALSDEALLAHHLALVDLAVRAMGAELGVAAAAASAYRQLELMLIPHLGPQEAGSEAARVTAGLGAVPSPHVDASASVYAGPTWRELGREPASLGIRAVTAHDEALEGLELRLQSIETWGHESLRAALRWRALRITARTAAAQLRRRELTKAAILRLGGRVRALHLELGRRLVDRGLLSIATDVELLTVAELQTAVSGRVPHASILGRRRRWRARYESDPPLPVRFEGVPEVKEITLPSGDRLDGWAASPGRYRGSAQVVRDPADRLDEGSVLVAEATDASWSPLFVSAGAIVVERGGPLSHAAILARELGIPAVLNLEGATRLLDDAEITVDGDLGVVIVHHPDTASAQSDRPPEAAR